MAETGGGGDLVWLLLWFALAGMIGWLRAMLLAGVTALFFGVAYSVPPAVRDMAPVEPPAPLVEPQSLPVPEPPLVPGLAV